MREDGSGCLERPRVPARHEPLRAVEPRRSLRSASSVRIFLMLGEHARRIGDRLLEIAERDPGALAPTIRGVGRALGLEVERVYEAHRRDPGAIGRLVRARVIRFAVKEIKRYG